MSRRDEILEAAYAYVLEHGITGASLRPIALAVGSSTGVLRFLFGSKDGLVAELLARARRDQLDLLRTFDLGDDLTAVSLRVWDWLSDAAHARLLTLWTECYAASLTADSGPWRGFAGATVDDWLAVLASAQPPRRRRTAVGRAERTAVLAVLRGGMLDLLATGDRTRTTAAVRGALDRLLG